MSNNMGENLQNTFWYVPTEYLPALRFYPGDGDQSFQWIVDQTLWHIEEYRAGYFTGKAYILTQAKDADPGWAYRVIVGSVTPDGNVYMSFIPDSQGGALTATFGIGRIRRRDNQPVFEMQMATGMTFVVSHWAYMEECKPGEPAWERLPGTDYSVPGFIAQCMEQVENEGSLKSEEGRM